LLARERSRIASSATNVQIASQIAGLGALSLDIEGKDYTQEGIKPAFGLMRWLTRVEGPAFRHETIR